MAKIEEKRPVPVFVDVQSHVLDGLEVLEELEVASRPRVIFVTACDYDEKHYTDFEQVARTSAAQSPRASASRTPSPMSQPDDGRAPEALLPLKPLEFSILLVLSREESYGYGIVQAISEREAGGLELAPGNLYHVLDRMLGEGLIREAERRERPDAVDGRRRYYAITPFGRRVARAEAGRLRAVVGTAEALELLPGESGG